MYTLSNQKNQSITIGSITLGAGKSTTLKDAIFGILVNEDALNKAIELGLVTVAYTTETTQVPGPVGDSVTLDMIAGLGLAVKQFLGLDDATFLATLQGNLHPQAAPATLSAAPTAADFNGLVTLLTTAGVFAGGV